jgi:hypothetical protein
MAVTPVSRAFSAPKSTHFFALNAPAVPNNKQTKNQSYGGVVARPNIAAAADWYVYSIQPLIDALP